MPCVVEHYTKFVQEHVRGTETTKSDPYAQALFSEHFGLEQERWLFTDVNSETK
jgi:hypothetical protein